MRAVRFVAAVFLALAYAGAGTSAAAAPRPDTCQQVPEVPKLTTVPWPQQRFDFDRIWKITTGTGIKVAVVDTGVDDRHPQLAGRVTSLDVTKTYLEDTCGHGTEVAGIIGAKDMRDQDRPLVGIAPGAKIVSVKYTNGEHSAGADPNLPKAIRRAADVKGVRVINVSSTSPDSPELRSAVKYAQSRDILIVAAAGNIRNDQQGKETPAYPAGYDGVIGVAAMDENGQVTDFSNERTQIAVAAPGAAIPSTRPGGVYHPGDNGTSFATPFVSGLAALVWAFHKDLDYQQVANRIEVTAEGTGGAGTGRGMVNPYEAITAEISDTAPPALAQPKVAVRPVRIDPPPPVDTRTRGIALAVTFGALGAAAMVSVAAVVIPMGRRRGWRPGRVELPREPSRPRG